MKETKSSIQFHDKKPGGLHVQGKQKYFRSILGRVHRGVWVPYLYASVKGGYASEPMNPEDTLLVLPQYGTFRAPESSRSKTRSDKVQASRDRPSGKRNKGKAKKTKR